MIVIFFTIMFFVRNEGATRRPKTKKVYKIALEKAYYTAPFGLCKKYRIFNPVDTFRAQAYAADIFRRCGARAAIKIGSKFRFPAFGESRIFHLPLIDPAKHVRRW